MFSRPTTRGKDVLVLRGRQLHEEAVRLHEEHAKHARKLGDEATAKKAEERAERARERARLTPPGPAIIELES
jgi:sRNA-binding protein